MMMQPANLRERPHQGLSNKIIKPEFENQNSEGVVSQKSSFWYNFLIIN